jgi:hypothetical protein
MDAYPASQWVKSGIEIECAYWHGACALGNGRQGHSRMLCIDGDEKKSLFNPTDA